MENELGGLPQEVMEFTALRKRLKITQGDVEKHFGLNHGAVSYVEKGDLRIVPQQIAIWRAWLEAQTPPSKEATRSEPTTGD